MARPNPVLPRAALVFLASVVALGWLVTVVAALRDPANSSSLLVVTGLLATVIGASFGIQVGRRGGRGDDDSGDGAA
jgi:hypothetical protein